MSPIKRLTENREAAFPRIGELRKGSKKKKNAEGKEVYGDDLKYFRFTTEDAGAMEKFKAAYSEKGKLEPTTINVYLPFSTPDENFQAWQEEYSAGGLKHRCDGETMIVWQTPDGKYSTEPKPCPYHTGQAKRTDKNPGCKATGRLTVIIPELQRFAYVTALTTSILDIMELTDNLNAVYALRGNLQGIPFQLKRRPKMISTPKPDGTRARYEKWMLLLEVNPGWAAMQLEDMGKRAMLPSGVKMLTSGHIVDSVTGEILDDDDDDTDLESLADVEPLPFDEPKQPAPKLPDNLRKKLHAVGTQAYGKEWNAKRPELVKAVTKGRAESSSDLTKDEAERIGSITELVILAKRVYGMDEYDANLRRIVSVATRGRTESYEDGELTGQEINMLISGLTKKAAEMKQAESPTEQPPF